MNNANLDVIVFPTWSDPPRLIGEYYIADGAVPWQSTPLHLDVLSMVLCM